MDDFVIRECVTISELDDCVRMQREVFGLPDLEISPRRHLIVSRQAGGWTLGAFTPDTAGNPGRFVGFVHHLAAIRGENEIIGYSHMMAVDRDYQNQGVGARLKWAQRERALAEGRNFIKWTWDPMQSRNAHFNLNRLGVTVSDYAENFYGTDYATDPDQKMAGAKGIDSDRLFANWELRSARVLSLADEPGASLAQIPGAAAKIDIPADWSGLLRRNGEAARREQLRVRNEFQKAFAAGLICAGFERSLDRPHYLLYDAESLK
jgi:predicted GNAT superfamily acetyltransferase